MGDGLTAARIQLRDDARRAGRGAFWGVKRKAFSDDRLPDRPDYEPIEMPRNSPTGVVCAFLATLAGFALIWHVWWLLGLGLVGAYVTFVVFAWRDRTDYEMPVDEVARLDGQNRTARAERLAGAQSA